MNKFHFKHFRYEIPRSTQMDHFESTASECTKWSIGTCLILGGILLVIALLLMK